MGEKKHKKKNLKLSFYTAISGFYGLYRTVSNSPDFIQLERETGFEPATSTLARLHSTTELFPR